MECESDVGNSSGGTFGLSLVEKNYKNSTKMGKSTSKIKTTFGILVGMLQQTQLETNIYIYV